MSARRSAEPCGFTLLECEIAILMLSLLVVGFMNLTTSHERLVTGMEGPVAGEPTYWVVRPADAAERALGLPATLATTEPGPEPPAPAPGEYAVTILDASLDAFTGTARALVFVAPTESEEGGP